MMKATNDKREFYEDQKIQISLGEMRGLTTEEIALFAKPCFDFWQMFEIRKAIEEGMPKRQIALIADSKLEWKQMGVIFEGIRKGLISIQIAAMPSPDLKWKEMRELGKVMEAFNKAHQDGLKGEE